jgi:hypothetical protein
MGRGLDQFAIHTRSSEDRNQDQETQEEASILFFIMSYLRSASLLHSFLAFRS